MIADEVREIDPVTMSNVYVLGMRESRLEPGLIQAYLETEYRAGDFVLRVGEPNQQLRLAQASYGGAGSAYVTAWNPYSRKVEGVRNENAHATLLSVVRCRGWHALEGIGQHRSGRWPGEVSLLVFGPSCEDARSLGDRFEQNAVVWGDEHGVPWLVLLR